ncbi:6-phosphofructokinase, partial [Klebsiella pneumoniae]
MKIGIVISGGDVSGMNNFIFQIARQAKEGANKQVIS